MSKTRPTTTTERKAYARGTPTEKMAKFERTFPGLARCFAVMMDEVWAARMKAIRRGWTLDELNAEDRRYAALTPAERDAEFLAADARRGGVR